MINIEAIAIKALRDAGYDAYADIPAERPGRFIIVELVSATRRYRSIQEAQLAVQCYAQTRYEASDLACDVGELVEGLVSHPEVTRAVIDNMYNYPDLQTGQPCYQLTASIVARP